MSVSIDTRYADGSVWFLELRSFSATWSELRLTAEDLLRLQDAILADPRQHPVIPGTGGLRKMRFAPPSLKTGKRGALRVCFASFERFSAIVLVLAFRKNESENLSAADKKAAKKLLVELETEIAKKISLK
jgi:hypothetical protein